MAGTAVPQDTIGNRFLTHTISFSNDLIFIIYTFSRIAALRHRACRRFAHLRYRQDMTPCSRAQVATGSRIGMPPPRRTAANTGWNALRSACANIALIGRIALAASELPFEARAPGREANGEEKTMNTRQGGRPVEEAKAAIDDILGLPPGDKTPHGEGRPVIPEDSPEGTLTSDDAEGLPPHQGTGIKAE